MSLQPVINSHLMTKSQIIISFILHLAVIIPLTVSACISFPLMKQSEPESTTEFLLMVLFVSSFLGLLFWFVINFCWRFLFNEYDSVFGCLVRQGQVVVDKNRDQVIEIIPETKFYYFWKYPYRNCILCTTTLQDFKRASMFFLDGDKVRRLGCSLSIQLPITLEDWNLFDSNVEYEVYWSGRVKIDRLLIDKLIINFFEHHYSELRGLYDPYDQEQQETFGKIAESWLSDNLRARGLTLDSVFFYLPN